MAYVPVTGLRKNRKKNNSINKGKWLSRFILLFSGIFFILVLPVLSQPFMTYGSIILAVCTLLFFGAIIVGFTLQLWKKYSLWLRARKHACKEIQKALDESASSKSFIYGLESIILIFSCALFLKLIQPFITAILWWQGYQLMEGKSFSLTVTKVALIMIEFAVYFGMIVFLILFSWSRWNDWRYGRAKRRRPTSC